MTSCLCFADLGGGGGWSSSIKDDIWYEVSIIITKEYFAVKNPIVVGITRKT
jgi:hypothetical protein